MGIEWALVLFTLVAGAGAGILVFAGVGEFFGASKKTRFIAGIASLALFIVGGCLSLLHLGNPGNFMEAAANLMSFSPISLELIFLGFGAVVAIVYIVVANREGMASKIVGVIGIVVGLIFMYVSGHGYEVVATRFAWATPALSISYLLTSLTLGGFLFLLLQVLFKDEAAGMKKVALVVLIVAVLETIALAAYGALAPLGSSAALFWSAAVVIGGIVAIAAGYIVYMKNMEIMVYVGAGAVLIGAVAFRAVMWLAGSSYIQSFFDIAEHSRSLFPL